MSPARPRPAIALPAILAALCLAACGGAPSGPDDPGSELAEVVAELDSPGPTMPKPAVAITVDGEAFKASAEDACLLRRAADPATRQFVLGFTREPEDGLVLHVAETPGEDGAHGIDGVFLVVGERFHGVDAARFTEAALTPHEDGWLLSGRFEATLVDLSAVEDAAAAPDVRLEGRVTNVFCLDLERLKAANAGP